MIEGREEELEKWQAAGFSCRVLQSTDGSFAVELRREPNAGGQWGFAGDLFLRVRPGSVVSARGATPQEAFDNVTAAALAGLDAGEP